MTDKETTSTSTGAGDEVNKGSDLVEILNDGRTTLDHYGPEYLKPEQLLEVLISPRYSGKTAGDIAADLLKEFGDLKDVVTASIPQLTKVKGIGFVKACQIKAAFELSKRVASYCEEEHPVITSIDDVVKLLAPHMQFFKQEEFRVILLDTKKRLINHQRISLGSLNASLVEPREVFRPALTTGAKYIILVHNHPSGDPEPSDQDILLTKQLCMCGVILGIEVLDHVIIGSNHVSMKDQKLM
ncbi:MAG: DNA repair protein RadC [Theionarchaea archaeon]|nr:MAG: hypothetical protein AYK18_11570 [Theionarchaea archaeon DG-70]MBU7012870.1 DNA repair protein RadC [Theionarchaea archaeon]